MSNQVAKIEVNTSLGVFGDANAFEHWQRIAKALSSSSLIPSQYQGPQGIANTLVALEFANRIGASPLMVMQNLNIIDGRPSWSATFITASLEASGLDIDYETEDRGKKKVQYEYWEGPKGQRLKKTGSLEIQDQAVRVVAVDSKGKTYQGVWVSLEMAVMEGWYTRQGSKWKTMPEMMLRYRAASFFGRMYRPGLLMGLKSKEEVEDAIYTDVSDDNWGETKPSSIDDINAKINAEVVENEITDEPATDDDLI